MTTGLKRSGSNSNNRLQHRKIRHGQARVRQGAGVGHPSKSKRLHRLCRAMVESFEARSANTQASVAGSASLRVVDERMSFEATNTSISGAIGLDLTRDRFEIGAILNKRLVDQHEIARRFRADAPPRRSPSRSVVRVFAWSRQKRPAPRIRRVNMRSFVAANQGRKLTPTRTV